MLRLLTQEVFTHPTRMQLHRESMTSLSKQENPAHCSCTASQFIDKTDVIVGTKRVLSNLLPLCYNLRYDEIKLN